MEAKCKNEMRSIKTIMVSKSFLFKQRFKTV